jgi:fumarylacetoacetase
LRHALFALLDSRADAATVAVVRGCFVPQADSDMSLPARIGNYTDFYTSYHHAHHIGRLFSEANDVVPANFHWIPIAYHGRASSVVVSETPVRRPLGQTIAPGAPGPSFGPSRRLDYELELGAWVGVGNALGTSVPLREAEDHLFGIGMLNDWSARDVQGWEMQPLGPFQAKNFSTSVSPWIVTMDAIAPYRLPWTRDTRWPQPLPYLDDAGNRTQGAIDIRLETWFESAARRERGAGPVRIAATSFRHQHWTLAQMLAHHTVGGCNLQSGDLLGSGTISGPEPSEAGAMMELTQAGRAPLRLDNGGGGIDERAFLVDGDAVIFRGWCERSGFARIGFGECRGVVLPALAPSAAGG